jgi:hypothetical protein
VPKAKKEKKAGVKTVVGLTFEELVMDKTKGVEHVTLLATIQQHCCSPVRLS